jgi:ABC-2 type transport system permease protein
MSLLAVLFSIMIASVVKSKSTFTLINSAMTVPIFMLSGCFWDYGMMSEGLRKIGDALPPRWIILAVEKLQGGEAATAILPMVGGILLVAILFFLLSIFFTRNKMVLVKDDK